ncbi:MAG: hypothetical protein QM723_02150 [Myxococcaceae bacterium]
MSDLKDRVRPDWKQSLLAVLELARAAGKNGMLVFDLDSTVFDNRPRQARIVREFGAERGIKELMACKESNFDSGWDLRGAMVNCGLSAETAEGLHKDIKKFWGSRFFTSKYCVDDVQVTGAAKYLDQSVATGARVLYITGRHEAMRAGTEECMKKCAMPMPAPGTMVELLMKPQLFESDDTYKKDTHQKLHKMGKVVAAFDNEPTHANDYANGFPEATVIHLATDHSGRPVQLVERIISVPNFDL